MSWLSMKCREVVFADRRESGPSYRKFYDAILERSHQGDLPPRPFIDFEYIKRKQKGA